MCVCMNMHAGCECNVVIATCPQRDLESTFLRCDNVAFTTLPQPKHNVVTTLSQRDFVCWASILFLHLIDGVGVPSAWRHFQRGGGGSSVSWQTWQVGEGLLLIGEVTGKGEETLLRGSKTISCQIVLEWYSYLNLMKLYECCRYKVRYV